MQQLLTLAEAAARLGVHVSTLRNWVRDGRVPAYRIGQRFTRVDWNELITAIATENRAAIGSSTSRDAEHSGDQPAPVRKS